jgi:hypothetical protein
MSTEEEMSKEDFRLPYHLNCMLKLLLEEESPSSKAGPCLEFFLNNRIIDILSTQAQKNV